MKTRDGLIQITKWLPATPGERSYCRKVCTQIMKPHPSGPRVAEIRTRTHHGDPLISVWANPAPDLIPVNSSSKV